jgi:HlyD family secretion protein
MGMDKPLETKKRKIKRIIAYSLASIFVLAVLFVFLNPGPSTVKVDADRITISTVTKGPFQEYIPPIGTVHPHKSILLSALEGGRVEKIFLEAGARVNKGDKILKLSNTGLLMTLLSNEAQVNRASNELRATRLQLERNRLELKKQRAEADYYLTRIKRKFERNKVLFNEQLISRQAFDEFNDEYGYMVERRQITIESQENDLIFQQQQVRHLEASVKQMQVNMDLLKQQMNNLTVRAPVSGQLTSLTAELGQTKSPGQLLGRIDESGGFRVEADIDELYIDRIRKGITGTAELAGLDFGLKVKMVYPEVKEGRFKVELEFPGKEPENMRRGQAVRIRLQLSEVSDALLLARSGFYQTTGGNWVYVIDECGEFAVKRPIRLGRQNPHFFEVLQGLKAGERVVISPYDHFDSKDRLIFK